MVLLENNYRSEQHIRTAAAAINRQYAEVVAELPRLELAELRCVETPGCFLLELAEANLRQLLRAWAERHYLQTDYRSLVSTAIVPVELEGDARLHELFGLLNRARLLTVLREGPYGSMALNETFEELLRPQLDRGSRGQFFAGAPVLITRNDHARRLFNGDVGVILKAVDGSYRAVFARHDGYESFAAESLPSHEPGFALTVHKSQGSEYDEVLLLLPPAGGRRLLTKEIVYTGITRARQRALICGTPEVLRTAIARRIVRESGLLAQE
jgi:exodeoxyribonuclease V alpha subunit